MRHAAHGKLIREIVSPVNILCDQPKLSHQHRVLEAKPSVPPKVQIPVVFRYKEYLGAGAAEQGL
jgi:hypothetical protein